MRDGSAIRQVVFEPRTLQLKSAGPRRGHPRINWAGAVRQHAVRAAGGEQQLQQACAWQDTTQARQVWAATVRHYLSTRASQGVCRHVLSLKRLLAFDDCVRQHTPFVLPPAPLITTRRPGETALPTHPCTCQCAVWRQAQCTELNPTATSWSAPSL